MSHRSSEPKPVPGRAADASGKLALLQLEDRLVPAGQITGQAFLDFNSNGLFDAAPVLNNDGSGTYTARADTGVAGVIVTAFDSANVRRGIATTDAAGIYTLSATGTGGYRLEYSNTPAAVRFGPQGAPPLGSATAVQFVPDGNSNNRNLSLSPPEATSDNPQIVTNEYRVGDQTGTLARGNLLGTNDYGRTAVIIGFPYSAGTTSQGDHAAAEQPTTHALAIEARYVGTTWGLAENTRTRTILAASFTKKHAGYGPNGPGAIYTMGTSGTTASLWIDLGTATVGGNFRSDYTNNDDYFLDGGNTGWDAVGKTSFGGLAINDAGTEVYTMNCHGWVFLLLWERRPPALHDPRKCGRQRRNGVVGVDPAARERDRRRPWRPAAVRRRVPRWTRLRRHGELGGEHPEPQ